MKILCPCRRTLDVPNHWVRQLRQITHNLDGTIRAVDLHGWVVFWDSPRSRWAGVCPEHRRLMPSTKPTGEIARLGGTARKG